MTRKAHPSKTEVPLDYERASNEQLVKMLAYVRDRSVSLLVDRLKDGDKLKGTSALIELLDRASRQLENTEKPLPGSTSEEIVIRFEMQPTKTLLELFTAALQNHIETGADIWSDELENNHECRTHKSQLIKLYETFYARTR
jgi:hypothetical protein